jgi:hypothetical protein
LYQGTTLVVPPRHKTVRALAPATAKSARNSNLKKAQRLKPTHFDAFTARLKSCPDTKQNLVAEPRLAKSFMAGRQSSVRMGNAEVGRLNPSYEMMMR